MHHRHRAFQARITGREKRDQRLAAGCTKLGDAGIDSVHGVAVREWKILPGCCCVRRDIDTSGQSIGSAKNAKNAKNAKKMFATESLNKSPPASLRAAALANPCARATCTYMCSAAKHSSVLVL